MRFSELPDSLLRRTRNVVRRLLKREPPEDPYAYVMARRRPRPGGRSAAAVLEEPEG
jgi:hypothetical protein